MSGSFLNINGYFSKIWPSGDGLSYHAYFVANGQEGHVGHLGPEPLDGIVVFKNSAAEFFMEAGRRVFNASAM